MRLLFIDPGIVCTGYCLIGGLSEGRKLWDVSQALDLVEKTGDLRPPDSSQPIGRRLSYLTFGVAQLVATWEPALVYVEVPAYSGHGGQMRRTAINTLLMATGAVIAGCAPVDVVTRKASRIKKEKRHEQLRDGAQMSSFRMPRGPSGGTRYDTWDAVWIAQDVVTEGDWTKEIHRLSLIV